MAAALVDPTVTGNYPVVLSDRLLNKDVTEIFTSLRYNHKPTLSSPTAPEQARLKPSVAGQTSSYDLSFQDKAGSYAYSGPRNIENSQYVLYFDPKRKCYVLDKVDSTFTLNLTSTPTNSSADSLRREFPHIQPEAPADKASKPAEAAKPAPKKPAKAVANKNKNVFAKAPPKSKAKGTAAKKEAPKKASVPLALPTPAAAEDPKPAPAKPKKVARDEDEDEDEEDDDDDGLIIEDPGASEARGHSRSAAPAFVGIKKFDEYMDQRDSAPEEEESEEDEGEFEEDPHHHQQHHQQHASRDADAMDVDAPEEDEDPLAGLEDDLAKDLENAFEDLENSQNGSPDGDESDISEEE